ncbi:restriction endonuclease [Rummeliibacillus sp. JY-2-4R]
MENQVCTLHKLKPSRVLMKQKIIVFCPECAKENIDKIVSYENKLASKDEMAKIDQDKKGAFSELLKGLLLSIYLMMVPWIIALVYPKPLNNEYFLRVSFLYKTYYTHPICYLVIVLFISLGIYYIIQASKKITILQEKKVELMKSSKELSTILNQFLSPKRINDLNDFIQGLRIRFNRINSPHQLMNEMSIRELQIFVIKSLKKLGYQNIQMNNHYDSFGIHFFAENEQGKNAISVVDDELFITMDDVHKIAIGKAYFNCHQCILVTASKLTEDAKSLAEKLYIDVWNQEKMDKQLNSIEQENWTQYLENYYDYSDADLYEFTKFELHALRKTS